MTAPGTTFKAVYLPKQNKIFLSCFFWGVAGWSYSSQRLLSYKLNKMVGFVVFTWKSTTNILGRDKMVAHVGIEETEEPFHKDGSEFGGPNAFSSTAIH